MGEDLEHTTTTSPDDAPGVTDASPEPMARHWGVVLAVGVITFALGVVLTVWPRETVPVVALLLALHLLVSGVAQLFLALASRSLPGSERAAVALGGVVAVVVGGLLLLSPLQTLTFIGLTMGLTVLVLGVGDLLGAMVSRAPQHRGWRAVRGIIGIVVGAYLIADLDRSLGLLVVIACVWLLSYGFITIVAALVMRSERQR